MEKFGLFIVFMVGIMLDAWALKAMWGWFVVPLGVVDVSYVHVLALRTVAVFMTTAQLTEHKKREPVEQMIIWIITPVILWLGGWVYQALMGVGW